MRILILARNTNRLNGNNTKPAGNETQGYGWRNIDDVLVIKKIFTDTHDVKIVSPDEDVYSQIKTENPDVVFNLCDDGFRGDYALEPQVAAMLDILGVHYTGSNYFTLALCQNKVRAKDILTFHKILTPKFQVFTSAERKLDPELKFPMIVKPVQEDGSVGIRERSVVNNEEQLREGVDHIIDVYRQEALVEEFINGREFTVPLIGNRRPIVLPIVEIDFSKIPANLPKIASYRTKWMKQSLVFKNTRYFCPARIGEEVSKQIEEIAKKCFKIFGCRGYAGVDFRYDEKDGKFYVLEVNPNPEISEESYITWAAEAAGMKYPDLLLKIIDFAIEKRY